MKATSFVTSLFVTLLVGCASTAPVDTLSKNKLAPTDRLAPTGKVDQSVALRIIQNVQPLQKTHLWWGFRPEIIHNHTLMTEIIRLSGSVGFYKWHTEDQVMAALDACDEIKHRTGKTMSIALNWSPWRTIPRGTDPATLTKEQRAEELQSLYDYCKRMQKWMGRRKVPYEVTHVLFDSEMLMAKPVPPGRTEAEHRALMTHLHNTQHDMVEQFFPNARVIWYAFGFRKQYGYTTPQPYPNHTQEERGYRCWSPPMYTPQHPNNTLNILNIQPDDGRPVIPWITLGGGYRTTTNFRREFLHNLPYDWELAYNLGLVINHPWIGQRQERIDYYGNWPRISEVCIYPGPFQHPGFAEKFGAYVAGANNKSVEESLSIIKSLKMLDFHQ